MLSQITVHSMIKLFEGERNGLFGDLLVYHVLSVHDFFFEFGCRLVKLYLQSTIVSKILILLLQSWHSHSLNQ
ncbi:hypothetical protein L1887_30048 [Cichorium endivia]|nr:hypothetical protein L1887_30048 [Cichorium endivia]